MSALNKKVKNFYKKVAEKFGGKEKIRTFAIPNKQSGGGEMVDTLL